MSPSQGRKPTSGTGGSSAKGARPGGPAATRRLGLLVFGVSFLVLFLIVAISEGLGDPSVPSGDVALVEDAPGDIGTITQADFDTALLQAAASSGQKKTPKPGDEQYDELKEGALGSLLDMVWLKGQADEMGISVTEKEVAEEFKKLKEENFKTAAEYEKFLKDSKYTQEDVDNRVELQMLSTEIQNQINESAPKPSQTEIENYYEASKETQFTQQATRDIRVILNKDKAKAEEAKAQLEKDDSAESWKKVAKEFSEEELTKNKGGQQKGIAEGGLTEPLNGAVFSTPEDRLEGPLKSDEGYFVFVVENSTPESVQDLADVESQIESQLEQQLQQEAFGEFVTDYTSRWRARTFCAEDYTIERCANFEADPHPATAPPACYEANPKKPADACPAPVFQLIPAMPGSITPMEPRGKPLAQRPVPAGDGAAAEAPPGGEVPIPTP